MTIEQDFFKRKRPIFSKLESAGFRMEGDMAVYREKFFEDQFLAELRLAKDGRVSGKVVDLDTGEEFLPLRVEDHSGGFVGSLRESYLEVLGRIADKCFASMDFMMDQSNRIAAAIEEKYGAAPEFPWEKYPGNGPFKRPDNEKWFAAMLIAARNKVDPDSEDETVVEVLNLKEDPDEILQMVQGPGIFHAWHMNKKHWISVVMDDTLPDEEVMELVGYSWDLTAGGSKSGAKVTSDAWLIPSNPAMYDVDAGFAGGREIEWHQHNNIKPGDEVYIYSSAPNSAIMYRCEVTASDLGYNGMFKGKEGYERSMRLRLVEKYPKEKYPLSFMKEHGASAVRGARRMPEQLLKAMKK